MTLHISVFFSVIQRDRFLKNTKNKPKQADRCSLKYISMQTKLKLLLQIKNNLKMREAHYNMTKQNAAPVQNHFSRKIVKIRLYPNY